MAEAGEWMAAVSDHGGSLERARARFPDAARTPPRPVDRDQPECLSVFVSARHRLDAAAGAGAPAPADGEQAARVYGAPSAETCRRRTWHADPLPLVAGLAAPGRARVLGPTYAEHARAAALSGSSGSTKSLISKRSSAPISRSW